MPIRKDAQQFVDFLNELFALDPVWVAKIVGSRYPCNKKIALHPTVQAMEHDKPHKFKAGFLGLMNGYFGTFDDGDRKGWGAIWAKYDDESGELLGFFLDERAEVSNDLPQS